MLFVSGDDSSSKSEVSEVIIEIGFAVIDLGDIATGSKLQQAKGDGGYVEPDSIVEQPKSRVSLANLEVISYKYSIAFKLNKLQNIIIILKSSSFTMLNAAKMSKNPRF